MPDSRKHESQDLEDYTNLDANDTLDGNPGDDPLDQGGRVARAGAIVTFRIRTE